MTCHDHVLGASHFQRQIALLDPAFHCIVSQIIGGFLWCYHLNLHDGNLALKLLLRLVKII